LTELDDAMLKHMTYIVLVERRPFTFQDFFRFTVNGKEYKMEHGTFRNKISKLNKSGTVELLYNSHIAFYTLKGHKLGKSAITHDHTWVTNSYNRSGMSSSSTNTSFTNHNHKSGNGYLYESIISLSLEHNSIHDIRLIFKAKGMWSMLYNHYNNNNYPDPELSMNKYNKDILFSTWKLDGILIRVTVHKTDTVSIIVACTLRPIPINFDGISKFTEMLTRTEERILNMIKNIEEKDDDRKNNGSLNSENTITAAVINIPHYNTWIITMWHFGADSRLQCTGEKFSITFKDGKNVLLRVYTKQRERKDTRIRIERQEYPRKSIIDAINEKLDKNIG
jgi:hypothetical protein